MDIQVTKIFDSEEDSWVFCSCEDYIIASRYFDSENLCRVRLISVDAPDVNTDTNKRKHQRIDNVYHEWNLTGVTDLSDKIAMDHTNKFVFIAHRDSKSISVFSLDTTNNNRSRKSVALNFKADFSKILPVSLEGVSAVAVLSANSELAVLKIDAKTNNFDVTTISCPLSFSGNTTFSSVYLRDSNVLVLTDTSNVVRLVRVDYHASDDEKEKQFHTVEFPTIQLPPTLTNDPLLGCVVQPKCIFALYANGELQAYKSKNEQSTSIMDWWQDGDGSTNGPLKLEKPTSTNYLKQNVPKNRASKRMCAVGGLSYLGDSYVVAAFGKFLSIWDATYLCDHALVDLGESVRHVRPSSDIGTLLCQSQSKVFALEIEAVGNRNVISLAEAIKRKGTCAKILANATMRNESRTLLEPQPVVTKWMKSAASAFAPVGDSYMRDMEKIQARESKQTAQLTNRNAVADGDALYSTLETLLRSKDTLKRGKAGNKLNLGLSQVPSLNFAAKAIARCLLGVHEKDTSFLKPLIDICGTCAVSSHSILAELRPMAAKLNITCSTNSIANLLLLPDSTHGIEAVLLSIPDLPETDIVRFAQFAVRMHKSYEAKQEQIKVKSAREIFRRGQLKMHRLLLRCMVAKTSARQLLAALAAISIADVKALLKFSAGIMERFDTRDVLQELKDGRSSDYRGAGDWLDKDFFEAAGLEAKEIAGCINWACALIDAHMASLLLDKGAATQTVLAEMLKHVRAQRETSEAVASVIGSLEHIREKLPLPHYRKPYSNYKMMISNAAPQ